MPRSPNIRHHTSIPYRFFGRSTELAVLSEALDGGQASIVALVGSGGQGKTATVQHWLESLTGRDDVDAVFLWSFYRGKDVDLLLRELLAYAEGLTEVPEVSASYCVDRLLPLLRRERWALVLDGAEVVQQEEPLWHGRFLHPELDRLLHELAVEPMPGVVVLTSRFAVPELSHCRHLRNFTISGMDRPSARGLLEAVGVSGSNEELEQAAQACGWHAKAIELLGTYLVRFEAGRASRVPHLGSAAEVEENEEQKTARVLGLFQQTLPQETQDLLALVTAFREPVAEEAILEYLTSEPLHTLLHETWQRGYQPFRSRPRAWLVEQLDTLVSLRLLERVGLGSTHQALVLDAHPLVRRGFEHVLGREGQRESALARAGFLRGRPERRRPETLEQAAHEVELFHAYCDAHLWKEADRTLVALDNPKHRFLAPAFERDLLLRFFPAGDWRQPPNWPGFGRYRSLAISLEMLGDFAQAIDVYRGEDAVLRGDALIALGRLDILLNQPHAVAPWHTLWQAYRAHALALAGRTQEAVRVASAMVPVDIYEWVHVYEALLRTGELHRLDLGSMLYRPPNQQEHRWSELARQRMRADYLRLTAPPGSELLGEYRQLTEEYDRAGLVYERALCRLGFARLLQRLGYASEATSVLATVEEIAARHGMAPTLADVTAIRAGVGGRP
jgi:hypothetical protein